MEWNKQKDEIPHTNERNQKQYEHDSLKWETDYEIFKKNQTEKNRAVDLREQEYKSKNPEAITDYCDMVLSNSEYPDCFPQELELEYNPQTKILIVDYAMPAIECIPKIREVKYVQSRDVFSEVFLNDATVNKLYDDLLYQITLRSIHELFEADVIEALDAIVFNGWVRSIDTSTGKEVNACILSVQAGRKEFLEINLAQIDPKACFKKLKGIGSAQLHGLSPIAPVLTINREDKRFVAAYDVADRLDGSYNLAVMDWQDFENLIREVFEKEFTQGGGEVKITQASRDGGVDAVAFDPDPIRGGKIVIQAKRYTNTVGVSAVRDLYGTVINEGATKGILVTTADYGPDAYSFAKDKPLTLLNGNNLLHLLGKYGHKARIDLKEAKKILGDMGTTN